MQPQDQPGSKYPKWKRHWTKASVVNNAVEEAALGGGWADTSAAFEACRGPSPARTAQANSIKWVDDWSAPEVSRHPFGLLTTMRQTFDGIAMVPVAAGILTESLLRNEMPELVWDSAIAAGWCRCASEKPQGIFPERVGHYWVWRDDRIDWQRLFHEEAEGSWSGCAAALPDRWRICAFNCCR